MTTCALLLPLSICQAVSFYPLSNPVIPSTKMPKVWNDCLSSRYWHSPNLSTVSPTVSISVVKEYLAPTWSHTYFLTSSKL